MGAAMGMAAGWACAQNAVLTVAFNRLPSREGVVRVAVYDRAEVFTSDRPADIYRAMHASARSGRVTFRIPVQVGACYGIVAYHDQDADNELDRNFWGVPTEPIAFSRDARPSLLTLSAPSFDDVKVCIRSDTTITLHLRTF